MKKGVIGILIFGFLVRLTAINQSLWLDEAISIQVADRYDPVSLVSTFSLADFHPPFYYILLHYWLVIFGKSVISARMLSVILSLATIYFTYLCGKELKSETVGKWAAAITVINPLLLYYSQEARMYSLATALLLASFYYWIKLGKEINKKDVVFFNICSGLAFLSFYGSIFFTGALAVILLAQKKLKLAVISNIGTIAACGLALPLVYRQFTYSQTALVEVKNWAGVLKQVTLKNILLIPIKFSIGRISFYPKMVYWLTALLATVATAAATAAGVKKNIKLAAVLVLPVLFGIIFSFVSPMMSYFRFLFLVPIMGIMIASGKKRLIKAGAGLVFGVSSLCYLTMPQFHREDWQSLTLSLDKDQEVMMIKSFEDPVMFYQPKVKVSDLRTADLSSYKEITVIPYGAEIHGLDYKELLNKNGFSLIRTVNYREISKEYWQK